MRVEIGAWETALLGAQVFCSYPVWLKQSTCDRCLEVLASQVPISPKKNNQKQKKEAKKRRTFVSVLHQTKKKNHPRTSFSRRSLNPKPVPQPTTDRSRPSIQLSHPHSYPPTLPRWFPQKAIPHDIHVDRAVHVTQCEVEPAKEGRGAEVDFPPGETVRRYISE